MDSVDYRPQQIAQKTLWILNQLGLLHKHSEGMSFTEMMFKNKKKETKFLNKTTLALNGSKEKKCSDQVIFCPDKLRIYQQATAQKFSSTLSKMYHLIHYSEVKKNMVAHEACIYQSSRLAEIILAIGNILHILKQSEWNYLYSGLLKALHSSFVSHFLSDIFKSCYWKATNKNKNIKFPVVSCECEKQPQKISKISVLFKIPWSFLACHF